MSNNKKKKLKPYLPQSDKEDITPNSINGNYDERDNNAKKNFAITKFIPWALLAAFIVTAFVILGVYNYDYLYYTQEASLWIGTKQFFLDKLAVPAGLLQWAGCYLTQYFYHPWLGISILVAIWVATYLIAVKAFSLTSKTAALALVPIVLLLCSEIDIAYHIYYLKQPGYWFSNSVGLLLTFAAVLINKYLKGYLKTAWIVAWTALAYPLMGWYALFADILMIMQVIADKETSKNIKTITSISALLAFVAAPLIWYQFFTQITRSHLWLAGFPIFQVDVMVSMHPTSVFIILAISGLCLGLVQYFDKKEVSSKKALVWTGSICIAVMLFSAWAVNNYWYRDYNYQAEMRMKKALEERKYDDVLYEASVLPDKPTRQMVISKNIALMHKGKLGESMFKYDNTSKVPVHYDSLLIRLVQTAAPMIYYHHGRETFAIRWCIENGVEFGYNVEELKFLIKAHLLQNEPKVALKYINILKTTTFQKEFAEKYEKYVYDKTLIDKDEEMSMIKNLFDKEDLLDSDGSLCEMYTINFFANCTSANPILSDVIVAYNLINKDIDLFWPRFFNYATLHKNQEMPIHYQEAAYLYGNLEHKVDISKMPFDQEKVVNRFASFQAMSNSIMSRLSQSGKNLSEAEMEATLAEEMKSAYGDTFWYFYFLCRNLSSY